MNESNHISKSDESLLLESSSKWDEHLSSDEDVLGEWDQELIIFMQIVLVASNIMDLFNANELEVGGHPLVYPIEGVCDRMAGSHSSMSMFKKLSKFTLDEFGDLCFDLGYPWSFQNVTCLD